MIDELIPTDAPSSAYAVRLHCTEGTSDKIYEISILPLGDLFAVEYRNGPRVGPLQSGTKTSAGPVPFPAAVKIMRSVLRDKLAKGYRPIAAAGAPVRHVAPDDTGVRPMLLEAVDLEDPRIERWIGDPNMVFQEKMNGHRRMVRKTIAGEVIGINRRGLRVPVTPEMEEALRAIASFCVLDGELVGDTFFVWDVIENMGVSLVDRADAPYSKRLDALDGIIKGADGRYIVRVPSAVLPSEKRALIAALKERRAEGFVVKRLDGLYLVGESKNQVAVKVKFWKSLSAVVAGLNAKRSVSLKLLDGDAWLDVGSVTIPSNQVVPKAGDIVEVRYLYAHRHGALFETSYLGSRTDIEQSECLASQRSFKEDRVETAAAA
jgi:bifunctional non-homologous end joining protein LigD